MEERYKALIMVFVTLTVAVGILAFINDSINSTRADDYNPFDYIRETEERVFINGTILHVEYIDWEHCELFMKDGWSYYFSKDAFSKLKQYEGIEVTIMCYVQGWDGYHRLYACNYDWDKGYVKPLPLE